VVHRALESRHGVGEALAAGGFGGDDGVFTVTDGLDSLGLMGVEVVNSAVDEGGFETGFEVDVGKTGLTFGKSSMGDDLALVVRSGAQPLNGIVHTSFRRSACLTVVVQ
jgi:hypothetical protein